jgi:lysozyme family protein
MNFDDAFHELLGHEGGYIFHPSDPGSETMWGVTAKVARKNGYAGDMRALPLPLAKSIYRRDYWDAVRAEELPEGFRFDVFDAAVNSGPKQAALWLQRATGAEPDGIIGPRTLAACKDHHPAVISKRITGMRLRFMTDLPTWQAFGKGWSRRLAANLMEKA